MRRVLVATLATVLAVVTAMLLTGSPTQADPKKLLVSNDGVTWGDNLTKPLFGELGPLVPQDKVKSSFFLKNNSHQPARATLAVVDRGPANDFTQALTFDYDVAGTTTPIPVAVDQKPKCKTYVTGPSIEPGKTQQVKVGVNFADVAGQTATGQTSTVDFVLTLSQVGPNGRVDICGEQAPAQPYQECKNPALQVVTVVGKPTCAEVLGTEALRGGKQGTSAGASGNAVGDSVLAATGAPRSVSTLLPLAVGLLVAGAGLMVVRRRREEPDNTA
ncbi:MAG: hypothetical protein ACTHOK_12025 [Nocardioidaceae bacterium]